MSIIGIDCDGVLTLGFHEKLLELLQEYGYQKTLDDFTKWDIYDAVSVDKADRVSIDAALAQRDIAAAMEPLPGTREAVDEMRKHHGIRIVTSSLLNSPTWDYERRNWLKEYFDIAAKDIIFTSQKHLVDVDALIDDKWDNVDTFSFYRLRPGVVIDRPWNRLIRDGGRFIRANSLADAWEKLYARGLGH